MPRKIANFLNALVLVIATIPAAQAKTVDPNSYLFPLTNPFAR